MISRLKIRQKFLFVNAITILVVLVFMGIWRGLENFQSSSSYLDNRIRLQAEMVASNISAAVLFEDWDEARIILSALKSDDAILGVTIRKAGYRESIEFQKEPESSGFDWYRFVGHSHQQDSVVVPVMSVSSEIAELETFYHHHELHEAIIESSQSILIEVTIALILGLIVLVRMQEGIIRPIDKLSDLTRHITESKNYSLRGNVTSPDEIGSLTNDFNQMLDIVEQRNQTLEDTVKHRTQQLENRNQQLAIQIQEREKSELARRETEKKFRQAFINAPIGMALVDKECRVLQSNRVLDQILFDRHENRLVEGLIRPEHRSKVRSEYERLVSGQVNKFELEVKCLRPRGGDLHMILGFSAIRSETNEFQYAVLQLRDVTESLKLAEELEYQATHDDLTGLPNRRVLQKAFSDAPAAPDGKFHVLCLLDLDQFKIVNDNCGHAGGDELLRQVARLLVRKVSKKSLVVRLGGDEFAILLHDSDLSEATKVTESIREAVERLEFVWQGQTFRLGATIGATTVGKTERDMSLILQRADAACYIAKDRGRNRVYIIQREDDQGMTERQSQMRWVQKLHDAIDKDEFVLFAQPIVPLQRRQSGRRVEVLLRMRDKEDGSLILPGAFIPAAERYGLSPKLDSWVVSTLIRSLEENSALVAPGTSYWVNLSGMSLGNDSFVEMLERKVLKAELPVGLLNFEITETAMIQNISKLSPAMQRLRKLGCKFALDDFGSGTSSFGYLKNLPVEYLKIDGMFVRNILEDEIDLIFVKSIIDIANVMGIQVVSEFVESEEIAEKLAEIGADFGQGYALGRPVPLLYLVDTEQYLDSANSVKNLEKTGTKPSNLSIKP